MSLLIMNYEQIRLRSAAIEVIKTAFKESFLLGDTLWIFGSRVVLTKRGGDIDLYVETNADNYHDAHKMRSKFWIKLQDALGEQKIDIIVHIKNAELERIHKVALATGIQLV